MVEVSNNTTALSNPPHFFLLLLLAAYGTAPWPICLSRNFSTRPQKSMRFFGSAQPWPSSAYSIHSTFGLVRLTAS